MIWPPSLKQTTTKKDYRFLKSVENLLKTDFWEGCKRGANNKSSAVRCIMGVKGEFEGGFHATVTCRTKPGHMHISSMYCKNHHDTKEVTRECTSLISLKLHISDRSSQTLPAFPAKARKYARQKEKEKRQKNITQTPHRNTNNETSMTCARLSLAATSCHLLNRLLLAEWTWFNPCISCHGFPFSPPHKIMT